MTIENYNGDVDTLHTRLITDYLNRNGREPDRWEWSHYMEAVQDSIESGNCWECDGSTIVVSDNVLVWAGLTGQPKEDFLLLLYVLNKYKDLRVAPLGNDLMGLHYIMNGISIKKWHAAQVAVIRTDITRFDVLDVAVYLHG